MAVVQDLVSFVARPACIPLSMGHRLKFKEQAVTIDDKSHRETPWWMDGILLLLVGFPAQRLKIIANKVEDARKTECQPRGT